MMMSKYESICDMKQQIKTFRDKILAIVPTDDTSISLDMYTLASIVDGLICVVGQIEAEVREMYDGDLEKM